MPTQRKARPTIVVVALTMVVLLILGGREPADAHPPMRKQCLHHAAGKARGSYKRFKRLYRACMRRTRQQAWRRRVPLVLKRIRHCESRGNYRAQNPRSTASGAYQFLDSTWGGHGGYARAKNAPPWMQDRKAILTWRAAGTTPWLASQHCWRH